MKQVLYYSLPLFGNQFKGEAYDMGQLCAKFQIWCRQFGIEDGNSLAMWVATTNRAKTYFGSDEKALEYANAAISKLPEQNGIIELTEI